MFRSSGPKDNDLYCFQASFQASSFIDVKMETEDFFTFNSDEQSSDQDEYSETENDDPGIVGKKVRSGGLYWV